MFMVLTGVVKAVRLAKVGFGENTKTIVKSLIDVAGDSIEVDGELSLGKEVEVIVSDEHVRKNRSEAGEPR